MFTKETTETIQKYLSVVPETLSQPLKDGSVNKVIDSIKNVYNLSSEQVVIIEKNILLVFLGLLPISNLQQKLIKELGIPESTTLDILDHLALVLIKDNVLSALLSIEKTIKQQENSTDETTMATEIIETEESIKSLDSVRTMAKDNQIIDQQHKEEVHTSSQSAILNKNQSFGQWETGK